MLGGYTLVDVAHKVVGIGSVGPRAYVALLEGASDDDVIFLQLKQALQTVSGPLLGWTTVDDRQFYVRQFRNMKGSVSLDAISASSLAEYAGIASHLLAKGHARTSGASMIAGYVGRSAKLDQAVASFDQAYADQTEADLEALLAAVKSGRMPMADGGRRLGGR